MSKPNDVAGVLNALGVDCEKQGDGSVVIALQAKEIPHIERVLGEEDVPSSRTADGAGVVVAAEHVGALEALGVRIPEPHTAGLEPRRSFAEGVGDDGTVRGRG